MTNYKIIIIGEYSIMPKFIQKMEIDEEWTKQLRNGFYAFEDRGSYEKISDFVERLKYIKQLDVDLYFYTQNNYGRWISYSNIEDPLGIWKEVEAG